MIYYIGVALICALNFTKLSANENFCTHSLHSAEQVDVSNDQNILDALSHLEKANKLAQSIKDEDLRLGISQKLKACQECLKNGFITKNYEEVPEVAVTLHENLGEILGDCSDVQIRNEIALCINSMIKDLGPLIEEKDSLNEVSD
jgi:hypothetical protein